MATREQHVFANTGTGTVLTGDEFTPIAGRVYVVWVGLIDSATPPLPTLSTTTGIAFGSPVVDIATGSILRVLGYVGVAGGGAVAGTVTVDCGANSQTAIHLVGEEWSNANASTPAGDTDTDTQGNVSTATAAELDQLTYEDSGDGVSCFILLNNSSGGFTLAGTPALLPGPQLFATGASRNAYADSNVTTPRITWVNQRRVAFAGIAIKASGDTTSQSVSGTVTPAGTVATQVGGGQGSQNVAGSVTPTGELVEIVVGLNDGQMEGFVTPAGVLTAQLIGLTVETDGLVDIVGELALEATLTLSGVVTPVGTFQQVSHIQTAAGSVGISGAVATLKIGGASPAGAGYGTNLGRVDSIGNIT